MNRKILILAFLAGIIGGLIGPLFWAATWSYTWDIATPPEAESPTYGYIRIQESKAGAQERLNVDHYFPLTGTEVSDPNAGKHRQITFISPISTPELLYSAESAFYTKLVSGKPELHFISQADGNEVQLTNRKYIKTNFAPDSIGEPEIQLANNAYLKALNAAGTAEISLIKADANNVPVVPDGAQTATDAPPTMTKGLTNKKYVDDQITAAMPTPNPMTGNSNSAGTVTFGNGFILKWNSTTIGENTTKSISHGLTKCFTAWTQDNDATTADFFALKVYSIGDSTFTVRNTNSDTKSFTWFAIGR